MKCLNCNNEMKETDKFCGICGTPNPNFGSAAEDDSSVNLIKGDLEAVHAGLSVDPLQSPAPQTQGGPLEQSEEKGREQDEETPQKEKRTAPLWLCILCIIIIFILSVACGALIQLHFGTPQTITNFAERILTW